MPSNYNFISLPQGEPDRLNIRGEHKFGHEKYQLNNQRYSGKLFLNLTVVSPVSVNSGITVMGSDLAQQTLDTVSARYVAKLSLIQSSVQQNQRLIIPGSSLKGVVRSIYEAITKSCLCKTNAKKEEIPNNYHECKEPSNLCPACVIFGAMSWLGLVHFHDAKYDPNNDKSGFDTGMIPPLFSPKPNAINGETREKVYYHNNKIRGRKLYPHSYTEDEETKPTIRIQQAELGKIFTTYVNYANLTKMQLGALLIALGQDTENRLGLKIGSGKAVGMGTMKIDVVKIEQLKINRYLSYGSNNSILSGNELRNFISDAIKSAKPQTQSTKQNNQTKKLIKPIKLGKKPLIQLKQLQELTALLGIDNSQEDNIVEVKESCSELGIGNFQEGSIVEVKESYSEEKMWDTAHAIAKVLVNEQQNIEPTKDGIRSELGKVIAYLRAAINQDKSSAGINFFKYLKVLVDNSHSLKHSDKTPSYYRIINKICNQHLNNLQSNPDKILEILGWTFRLFNYYKFTPLEDFEELSVLNRKLEIQTAAKSKNLKLDDEVEAEITNKSGNKVTYKMFNTFTKTVKEPKKHQLLEKGQEVIVKITEIEDGVPKKVKYVKHKS